MEVGPEINVFKPNVEEGRHVGITSLNGNTCWI